MTSGRTRHHDDRRAPTSSGDEPVGAPGVRSPAAMAVAQQLGLGDDEHCGGGAEQRR